MDCKSPGRKPSRSPASTAGRGRLIQDTMLASKAIGALLALAAKGEAIGQQTVRYVVGLARSGQADKAAELTADVICITSKGRPVKAKTIGQGCSRRRSRKCWRPPPAAQSLSFVPSQLSPVREISAEERDGCLVVTLSAECREQIGRFIDAP